MMFSSDDHVLLRFIYLVLLSYLSSMSGCTHRVTAHESGIPFNTPPQPMPEEEVYKEPGNIVAVDGIMCAAPIDLDEP